MPVVVGVVSSTTACNTRIYNLDSGEIVSSGHAPYPATTPPRSEQFPGDLGGQLDVGTRQIKRRRNAQQ